MRIYVGNLPYDVTEEQLRQEFQAFGEIESINFITDKYSGRPKGFGFVEMASQSTSEQLWLTRLVLAPTVEAAGALVTGEGVAIVVAATAVEVVGLGEGGKGDFRITLYLSLQET
jgi:hypothetical protein